MQKTTIVSLFAALALLGQPSAAEAQTKAQFTLPTPWTQQAWEADVPLDDYPRPQMQRAEWLNLNGTWQYMGGTAQPDPLTATAPPAFTASAERIKVPFPPESDLSGIRRSGENHMWYRRTFSIPAGWKGRNVMLNFGAVDRHCVVFVNGKKAGTHTGGYSSFSLDITRLLRPGSANTIVVGASDPNDGKAPCGKNGDKGDYICTSGIWQTVWLEPVAGNHIDNLKLVPDVKGRKLYITAADCGKSRLNVVAVATAGGKEVARATGTAGARFAINIDKPHLWSPDDPFLYGLKLRLTDKSGKVVDEVDSYFGMRSIELGRVGDTVRPLLNGKFLFQIGLLDQGYWPDGVFTAPTDEALRYDIELAKRSGFNVIRKHIKVEPQRWYYHCDRLGLLVWQDMPNLWYPDGPDSVAVRQQFRDELKTMIDQHTSSPAIVTWVPFNENWGAFEVESVTDMVKKYDPTRLVNGNCGYNYAPDYRPAQGDAANSDFADRHHYGKLEPKAMAQPDGRRIVSLGEFGGKGLFVRGHMWPVRNDAYEMMTTSQTLTDRYVLMLNELEQMVKYNSLSCAIYTQTTDVEHEINGLVTYDRQVEKMDLARVRDINQAVIADTQAKP